MQKDLKLKKPYYTYDHCDDYSKFSTKYTAEQNQSYMNDEEQQSMFKEMGVKKTFIGKSFDDPRRATEIFQGPENVLYDSFMNPETKPIVEASGHIYARTKITRWIT